MADETFERLLGHLQMDPKEKMAHMSEILTDTVAFFKEFKEVMSGGTHEEKTDMLQQAHELQKVMSAESHKVCDELGISDEELQKMANDAANYTEGQWEEMQKARGEIDREVDDLTTNAGRGLSSKKKSDGPRRPRKRPSGWIKS